MKVFLAIIFGFYFVAVKAQCPWALDQSFNEVDTAGIGYSGTNGPVSAIAVQSDGKILIGGNFTSYNGEPANYITRLNEDGTIDASFNTGTGANGIIQAISIQADGKVLIGGYMTEYNGTAMNRLARLHSNGTLDTSFDIATGVSGVVRELHYQPDGKILVGGVFHEFDGVPINSILRLNSNGSLDNTFSSGLAVNDRVSSVSRQVNDNILLGGYFNNYSGVPAKCIVRLHSNGSLDNSFALGTGADTTILATRVQPDGKILVVGMLETFNGETVNHITRLDSSGVIDTSFHAGLGTDSLISCIALQPDGKILIAGHFTSYDGVQANRIARLNPNATLDSSFSAAGASNTIEAIVLQPDNKILVGGKFTELNGFERSRISRIFEPVVTYGNETKSSCGSFFWASDLQTYTTSGNYVVTLTNAQNCDSIVTLNLTIDSFPDNLTMLDSNTIVANSASAAYQWLNCDSGFSLLTGKTSQSFTPEVNGSYAVELTENGCVDTSDCVEINTLGLSKSSDNLSHINVYPNPTTGALFVQFDKKQSNALVKFFDVNAQLIRRQEFSDAERLNMQLPEIRGVYLIEVTDEKGQVTNYRVVKK